MHYAGAVIDEEYNQDNDEVGECSAAFVHHENIKDSNIHSTNEKYLRLTYNDQTNIITNVCQNNDDKKMPVCICKIGSQHG